MYSCCSYPHQNGVGALRPGPGGAAPDWRAAMRRLRSVSEALAPTSTAGLIPPEAPRRHSDSVGEFERSNSWTADGHRLHGSRGAGPALLQDEQGAVLLSQLALLEHQKAGAAAAEDYRTAAALQAMLEVLAPRPTPLPQSLSSYVTAAHGETEVRAAADFFLENGFCVVPGRVAEPTLGRVRANWMAAEDAARAEWETKAAVSRGRWGLSWASGAPSGYRTFFDLGDLTSNPSSGGGGGVAASPHWDLACALVEVAAHPGMIQTAAAVLGSGAHCGGIPSGRVVPPEDEVPGPVPGTKGGDGGYTSWHRDSPPPDGWPTPHSRRVKAFCSFWDTTADGGATAVVPKSHRTPAGPKDTLARKFTGGGFVHSPRPEDGLPMAAMPNNVPLALPAGVIFLIDQAVWHGALPNTTATPRRNVIIGLHAEPQGRDDGVRRATLEAAVARNVAEGLMTRADAEAAFHL